MNTEPDEPLPKWACPGCGACIGYIGRFFQKLGLHIHSCGVAENEEVDAPDPPMVELLYAIRETLDALTRVASEVLDPRDARVSRAWDGLEKINAILAKCENP